MASMTLNTHGHWWVIPLDRSFDLNSRPSPPLDTLRSFPIGW